MRPSGQLRELPVEIIEHTKRSEYTPSMIGKTASGCEIRVDARVRDRAIPEVLVEAALNVDQNAGVERTREHDNWIPALAPWIVFRS